MKHDNVSTIRVVAAMLSALMSSLAAVYNSAATVITNDICKLVLKNTTLTDSNLVMIGRISACVFVCISLLWLPVIEHGQNELFTYTQAVSAYIQNPLSVVYFFGMFWNRANVFGAYCAIISGFLLGFTRFILYFTFTDYCDHTVFCSMNYLYFGLLMWMLCALLMVIGSLLSPKPSPTKIDGFTYWSIRKMKEHDRLKEECQFQRRGLVEMEEVLSDENDEDDVASVGNAEDDNHDIVVERHGCCHRFIHLEGDEANPMWNTISHIMTAMSLVGLLTCWIVFS